MIQIINEQESDEKLIKIVPIDDEPIPDEISRKYELEIYEKYWGFQITTSKRNIYLMVRNFSQCDISLNETPDSCYSLYGTEILGINLCYHVNAEIPFAFIMPRTNWFNVLEQKITYGPIGHLVITTKKGEIIFNIEMDNDIDNLYFLIDKE